jgi:SulP family sulfate permease
MLFIREQVGGAVVRRKAYGNVMFSKQVRLPAEVAILERRGDATVIFELQGSLFFGTTDRLYTELEPELKARDYIILDMRRVQSVDITAVHLIEQIVGMLSERNGVLIFSEIPHSLPSGRDLHEYFDAVGLARPTSRVKVFEILDEALEWVENRILEQENLDRHSPRPLELEEISLFTGRKQETLDALRECVESRTFPAGTTIFSSGETGDEVFLIRRGEVRIILQLAGHQYHHLATFGRGDFFGEMAFLDHAPRSADAVALSDTEVFVLSRERFDTLAAGHKKLGMTVMEGLARELAIRLRHTSAELRALEES